MQREKALQWAADQDLPRDLRDKAKQAANHADVALGLQDAMARKMGLPGAGLRQPDDPMNQQSQPLPDQTNS